MTGSLSTAALLTGTTAGVVALVTLGLAQAARRAGLPRTLAASVAAGMIACGSGRRPRSPRAESSPTGRPCRRGGRSCP